MVAFSVGIVCPSGAGATRSVSLSRAISSPIWSLAQCRDALPAARHYPGGHHRGAHDHLMARPVRRNCPEPMEIPGVFHTGRHIFLVYGVPLIRGSDVPFGPSMVFSEPARLFSCRARELHFAPWSLHIRTAKGLALMP